jgi:HEAT repeat protein
MAESALLITGKKLWIAVATLVVATLLGAFLMPASTGGKIYQGKPLKDWCLLMFSNDPRQRAEATNFFGMQGVRILPELVVMLEPGDPYYRNVAWHHTDWLPQPIRVILLRRIRYPASDEIRMGATRALGMLGPAASMAAPALGKILEAGKPPSIWESAGALARLGASGVPALTNALQHRDATVRQAAASGLEQMGPSGSNAVPALVARLGDLNDPVREAVIRALASMSPASTHSLLEQVEHGQIRARIDAARALGMARVSRRLAEQPLLHMAEDPDAEVRSQALEALGDVLAIDPPAVARLIEGLGDDDRRVRASAAKSLGQLQGKAAVAVPALQRQLQDKSDASREAAAKALGQIGKSSTTAIPDLERLLQDRSPSVRQAATNALLILREL